MKITPIFIILFLAGIISGNAQPLKPDATIKTSSITFITTMGQCGYMEVANSDNTIKDHKPRNQHFRLVENGIINITTVLKQTFSEKRLAELAGERGLVINYYCQPSGKVMEVSFLIRAHTLVTAAELEQLETAIKSSVSIKLDWYTKEKADFAMVAQVIHFYKLLADYRDKNLNL